MGQRAGQQGVRASGRRGVLGREGTALAVWLYDGLSCTKYSVGMCVLCPQWKWSTARCWYVHAYIRRYMHTCIRSAEDEVSMYLGMYSACHGSWFVVRAHAHTKSCIILYEC